MSRKSAYTGLALAQLLELEAELCTPLKRAEWVKHAGADSHLVRVALLRDVARRCEPKGLRMSDLAPVLARNSDYATWSDQKLQNTIYNLFNSSKSPKDKDNVHVWNDSAEVMGAMLQGLQPDGNDGRTEVVTRIVDFFFPDRPATIGEIPPPFFKLERTSSLYVGCPHDASESNFYTVSLARSCYRTNKRARWFMASGGDLLEDLAGPAFELWAERMTAALCFDLDFIFVIPETKTKTRIEEFFDRLHSYWNKQLSIETLRDRYPELRQSLDGAYVEEKARTHLKVVTVTMSDPPKNIDSVRLTEMFPFLHYFDALVPTKSNAQAYGPTFLNPWLRFHWADVLDLSQPRGEPKFAAIAFNDKSRKTNLILVPPDSMIEYLKWLATFVGWAEQANAPAADRRIPRKVSGASGR